MKIQFLVKMGILKTLLYLIKHCHKIRYLNFNALKKMQDASSSEQ
jgi:hypothetical protein